jgi:hypothetical protein
LILIPITILNLQNYTPGLYGIAGCHGHKGGKGGEMLRKTREKARRMGVTETGKGPAGAFRETALAAAVRLLAVSALAGWMILGCGEDCSQAARLGDFEFSQGNYPNAVRQYEKALRADAECGVVADKLAEAKRKAGAGK